MGGVGEHNFPAVKYGEGGGRINNCGLIIQRATESVAKESGKQILKIKMR